MERDRDNELQVWPLTSDSPLNSDDSYGSNNGFGDLTINGVDEAEQDFDASPEGATSAKGEKGEGGKAHAQTAEFADDVNDRLLRRLANKFDDFNATAKCRSRLSHLTELTEQEKLEEPALIGATDSGVRWPCYCLEDSWTRVKAYMARKWRLPCCQEYAWPQEIVRHRRFIISKKAYCNDPTLSKAEVEAILRWADLVRSKEWKEGLWNEKGVLHMADIQTFRTGKVTWSAMEEHLAQLAYSQRKPLVFLAARICVETLAKNRGIYDNSQQYWGFTRICTDLLRSPYPEVQEAVLLALQLYIWTLKIFHCCFSNKCSELASAGLFPVLFDLLGRCPCRLQSVIVNITVLMAVHNPYVRLMINMGGLDLLVKITSTQDDLLRQRVFGCLEMFAKNVSTQEQLIGMGVVPLVIRQLARHNSSITLSCLITLNCLCQSNKVLAQMEQLDNGLLVKAIIGLLHEERQQMPSLTQMIAQGKTRSDAATASWSTVRRQALVLTCKLCIYEPAGRLLVKRGLVKRLRTIWGEEESVTDRALVMESLASLSKLTTAAEKICQEDFLLVLASNLKEGIYQEPILATVHFLGKRHLPQLLESHLIADVISLFGDKAFHRKHYPNILSTCAQLSTSERVQKMLVSNYGRPYSLVMDTAFSTQDLGILHSCVGILSKIKATEIPLAVLKANSLLVVAYVDRLLKTGPDGLVLHGLMQLQDFLQVEFLRGLFREHHTQRVLEVLSKPPYQPPVQLMAKKVLEMITGRTSRRSSLDLDSGRDRRSFDDDSDGVKEFDDIDENDVNDYVWGASGGGHVSSSNDRSASHHHHHHQQQQQQQKKKQQQHSSVLEEDILVDYDAAVQVNIIDATDNEADDDDDVDEVGNLDNNGNRQDDVDDDDDDNDDFEIIQMTSHEDAVV